WVWNGEDLGRTLMPGLHGLGDVTAQAQLVFMRLGVLVGGFANKYHLGLRSSVTETVKSWHQRAPEVFTLPHPSWRNTAWLKKNPWFEEDLLPVLQARVQEVMYG
ncbi:MAG: uracil-DNA glycosylase family protein, partial [Pseudomonadota bacterium]